MHQTAHSFRGIPQTSFGRTDFSAEYRSLLQGLIDVPRSSHLQEDLRRYAACCDDVLYGEHAKSELDYFASHDAVAWLLGREGWMRLSSHIFFGLPALSAAGASGPG